MRILFVTLALGAAGAVHGAGLFECQVLDGVYKVPGKVKTVSALIHDAQIVGEVFTVRTRIAEVKGNPLYETKGHKVEVLRSTDDEFTVLIRDAGIVGDDDISVITLDRFDGKWSFKHYNSWHGLLTSGSCKEL